MDNQPSDTCIDDMKKSDYEHLEKKGKSNKSFKRKMLQGYHRLNSSFSTVIHTVRKDSAYILSFAGVY